MQYKSGKTVKIICVGCKSGGLNDPMWLQDFLGWACNTIGMTSISGPFVKRYVDGNDESKDGVSAVLMIAESHIAVHTWPSSDAARVVIDSCRDFDEKLLISKFRRYLKPEEITVSSC